VLFLVYSSDALLFKGVDTADNLLWPHQRLLGKARTCVGKTLDSLNPFYSRANILRRLPVYELTLAPPDVRALYVDVKEKNETNAGWDKPGQSFRKVALKFKGRDFKAKMKLHGDTITHWSGKKRSFQLKAPKDEFIEGKNRLIFNIPEKRNYLVPIFADRLAARMGLDEVESDYVAVKINGVFQGIYFMEEFLDAHWLERREVSNGAIVQLSDNWLLDRLGSENDPHRFFGGITFNDHHTTPFDLETGNLKPIQSPLRSALSEQWIAGKTSDLFDAIRTEDVERFERTVDVEKIGAIEAWRTLFGDRWSLFGDNLRMVYSYASGKFYFIPRSQGMCETLEYHGGSFEYNQNRPPEGNPLDVKMFGLVTRSRVIREIRNHWIRYFVDHRTELLEEYDQLIAKFLPTFSMDETLPLSSRELKHKVLVSRANIAANLDRLRRQYDHVKAYVNIIVAGNSVEIEIVPDTSLQGLTIDRLILQIPFPQKGSFLKGKMERYDDRSGEYVLQKELNLKEGEDLSNLFSGESFGYDFQKDFTPEPKRYRFRFVMESPGALTVKKAEIKFRASLSGTLLADDDVYVTIAKKDLPVSKVLWTAFKAEGVRLVLPAGKYSIAENVVIPEGYEVLIEKGAEISIAPGINFLSYSPVTIDGTEAEKVIVRALEPGKSFGVFAVEGSGSKNLSVRITGLDLSGGNEAIIDGLYFSGGLCVYHADLWMRDSRIHDNFADDGLNAKYAKIDVRDSQFFMNAADQVDLDFCKGIFERNRFESSGKVENGDGLDVSGTDLMVRSCAFENFLDKGISIGENSRLFVYDNFFTHNKIGSAVKDSSHALFIHNSFQNNETAVSAYRKKPIFYKNQAVYTYQNRSEGNKAWIQTDAHSRRWVPSERGAAFLEAWDPEKWTPEDSRIFDQPDYWLEEK